MTYSEALIKAKLGKLLLLPKWEGYFLWDYGKSILYFRNNNYVSYDKIFDLNLDKRNDWYYII